MRGAYLREFQGTYLEDSYFLGMVAEGRDLRLKMLFALTADHPAYERPRSDEQHCYRAGSILIREAAVIEWHSGRPTVRADSDGTFDFGSLELHLQGPNSYRVVTEWFETTVATPDLGIHLS